MAMRRTRALAAGLLAVTLLLGACTGGDEEGASEPEETTTPSPSTPVSTSTGSSTKLTKPSAPLQISIVEVRGGVQRKQRAAIRQALRRPIQSWIQAGFLGGEYPRKGYPGAFDAWTPQAASLARQDRNFTTNAAVGEQLVGVVADRQQARLFVFANGGLTGGATARIQLKLTGEKSDGTLIRYAVQGSLTLTRDANQWRVFGYDLTRTEER